MRRDAVSPATRRLNANGFSCASRSTGLPPARPQSMFAKNADPGVTPEMEMRSSSEARVEAT